MCEREDEILSFKPKDYWSVNAELTTESGVSFTAALTHLEGKRVQKFSLSTSEKAEEAVSLVKKAKLSVKALSEKITKERAPPPYRTSTLQQDAALKLKWSSKKIMDVAQSLYDGRNNTENGSEEGGLITYMRTDGVSISSESVKQIRASIVERFGRESVTKTARVHTSKVLNAQEAHEAIHPTRIHLAADDLPPSVTADERKLYQLIWERTMASQMSDAQYLQKSAEAEDQEGKIRLRSTARKAIFKGFTAVYKKTSTEDEDAPAEEKNPTLAEFRALEKLKEGDVVSSSVPALHQHSTKPPPRYSEASIVKSMEALGIGRPSTYASTTSLLVKRGYLRKYRHRFFPQPLGRVLSVYLEHQFEQFIDYEFTSSMETRLDDIATGKEEWKTVVQEFWKVLDPSVQEALTVQARDVIDYVNARVLQSVFLPLVTEQKPLEVLQKCPICKDGNLMIKFSKYGPFLGCDNYNHSKCNYKSSMKEFGIEEKTKADTNE